jgi:DNA-binding HxlR family transcriptional regulator
MNDELARKIEGILVQAMADAFNRSLNALEEDGAIDRTKMMEEYRGVGSKYYDMVTEQLEYTAQFAKENIRKLIEDEIGK